MTPQEASRRYHWIEYNPETNTIDMFLDNFMLSSLRMCESKFYMEHIALITPRYTSTARKPWYYDFGEFLHYCLEKFYDNFKKFGQAPKVDDWIEVCKKKWLEMKMDEYATVDNKSDRNRYEEIEGWNGACGLLIEYYGYYISCHFRVVDTEITFGHDKEVFIGKFGLLGHHQIIPFDERENEIWHLTQPCTVNCYLTGRIDLLVDNGYKIGPVDHKSTSSFDGYEHEDYNPHDGVTGYILATHEILKKLNPLLAQRPHLSSWIQHIASKRPSEPRDKSKVKGPRFKTTPIDKTEEQLEDYKRRQLSTFKRIATLLFDEEEPQWNTTICNNIFYRKCPYQPIHTQPSSEWLQIISNHYVIGKQWDTRDHFNVDNNNNSTNVSTGATEVKST